MNGIIDDFYSFLCAFLNFHNSVLGIYIFFNDIVLSTYYVSDTMLGTCYVLFLISQQPYELGIIITILKMRKLGFGKVRKLVHLIKLKKRNTNMVPFLPFPSLFPLSLPLFLFFFLFFLSSLHFIVCTEDRWCAGI